MSARVLSTEEAKQAIAQLQNIINNGFVEQIQQMDAQGKKLSDKNVWDGPLANQFSGNIWPDTHKALMNAKDKLIELQQNLDKISTDIFQAGGGS